MKRFTLTQKNMKKITLNLLKGLLVIVLFTGVSVVSSATGVQTVGIASAKGIGVPYGLSQQATEINQYLTNKGYNVYSVSPIKGTGKWKAVVGGANGTTTLIIDGNVVNSKANNIVGSADGAL